MKVPQTNNAFFQTAQDSRGVVYIQYRCKLVGNTTHVPYFECMQVQGFACIPAVAGTYMVQEGVKGLRG